MRDRSVLVVEESSVVSDLVRDLLEAAGFSVVQTSTSRDALALLREKEFGVAVVDADMPKISGYQVLEQVRETPELTDLPVLIITGAGGDSNRREGAYGLTAQDYIHKPIDPVELIVRVRTAVGDDSSPIPLPGATMATPEPEVRLSTSDTPGEIITVFSLKGGVGTSTIAVNLAVAIQRLWSEHTALADLSLEAGALNVLLDILPTATLDELVAEKGKLSSQLITQYLVPHKSGVSLLSAPPSPERAELVDGPALRKILTFLRECFDYIVIDTASTFADHTLVALELADHIVLPIIGDISSIRAATTALDIFQALNIQDDKVTMVFNELFPKAGLSRKHAETSLHLPTHFLPFGGPKLLDSVNLGAPIVMSDPDGAFSQAVQQLAISVSRPDSEVQVPAKSGDLLSKVRMRFGA